MSEFRCPSCAAPLTIESRFSKVVICGYCAQTSEIKPSGLFAAGSPNPLAELPSVLKVGATGSYRGESFKALGRVRFNHEDGYWDEWLLSFQNGRVLWLQEDEGELTVFEKEGISGAIPNFDEAKVGTTVSMNGHQVFVIERCEAIIGGGQGELNFRVFPGQAVNCIDGAADGRVISVEYLPDEIALFVGDVATPENFELNG